jgi:hypothetical protein
MRLKASPVIQPDARDEQRGTVGARVRIRALDERRGASTGAATTAGRPIALHRPRTLAVNSRWSPIASPSGPRGSDRDA